MDKKYVIKGNLKHYVRWPFYLSTLLIVLNALVYLVNLRIGALVTLGIIIYIGVAIAIFKYNKPEILKDLVSFASQYSGLEKELLENLKLPYCIIQSNGQILWTNSSFEESVGKKIGSIFSLDIDELNVSTLHKMNLYEVKEFNKIIDNKNYKIVFQAIPVENSIKESKVLDIVNDDRLIAVYMYDETELVKAKIINEDNKLIVALAYIDNYDESLENVDDVQKSMVIALLDRVITKYFRDFDGIVRKIEKDKYFLVLKQSSLNKIKEQNFRILEEVKKVNVGNDITVTLSVGVGLNGENFNQSYEFARIAMEMALGRGGDQAVVKNGAQIDYFGGKAPTMEKNTRVKARVKAQALKEFMSSKERVIIMGHKLSDVDALGAGIGIYCAAKSLGKAAHIVINDPTTSVKPLIDAFIDNPEYDKLMFIESAHAKNLVDNNTLVVVVDTNKPSYTECPELLEMTKTIVVFDHHRRGSEIIKNAILYYVEPYASSTCEMVAEILQYFSDNLKLKGIEADCLYAGIIIDTNNFTNRAGVRTFEAAAFLKRNGADITRVRKILRDDIKLYRAKAIAIRNAEIYKKVYAITICPSENIESPTVAGAQAANELLNIAGIKASFVLTEFDQRVFISARAIDELNVQLIMEKLGGGGHINVAGAQLDCDLHEAERRIKDLIDEFEKKER